MSQLLKVLLVVFVAIPVMAAESLWRIDVAGNERTDPAYVEALTLRCLADTSIEAVETAQVEQCVLNARIFASVKVEQLAPAHLLVRVEDRWTLFPVPVISADTEGSLNLGFFAAESNFLGRGKNLVLGLTYGSQRSTLLLAAYDPSIAFTPLQGSLALFRMRKESLWSDRDGVVDAFLQDMTRGSFGLGWRTQESLSFMMSSEVGRSRYGELQGFVPPRGYDYWNLALDFRWSQFQYKFYFDEGSKAHLAVRPQLWRSDSEPLVVLTQAGVSHEVNVVLDHALQSDVSWVWLWRGDKRDAPKLGGRKGFRGVLSDAIWVRHAWSVSLDYQIPVGAASFGTWTVAPFVDYGQAFLVNETRTKRNVEGLGYGGGIYLYLQRLALPGMGLVFSQNTYLHKPMVMFSLGSGGRG